MINFTSEGFPSISVPLWWADHTSRPICDLSFPSLKNFLQAYSSHETCWSSLQIRKISESIGTDSSRCQRFQFLQGPWTTQRLFPKTLHEDWWHVVQSKEGRHFTLSMSSKLLQPWCLPASLLLYVGRVEAPISEQWVCRAPRGLLFTQSQTTVKVNNWWDYYLKYGNIFFDQRVNLKKEKPSSSDCIIINY